MHSAITLGITAESSHGQSGPAVRVSVPLDAQASNDAILAAVRRCRMLAEQSLPNEPQQRETSPTAPTHQPSVKRFATEKQINAIAVMSKRQGITLDRTLHDRFGVSALSALTISEASTLIDELKGKQPASK
ncbi:hypothetical protein [Allorhodopirellula heiligendammensis]|uniref:Uncharacterized protein n=1 Tax=Allorhodopirellula heiligendammensis TaxID=2714739 RepID=A0A5C6C3V6_9BACT|nr:hypothetical protein [Allorhodopirellula heiligendammensis]TWU19203.1 hypothetical protein Poly21_13740 [Allorhodopirellula heiligendammensis]